MLAEGGLASCRIDGTTKGRDRQSIIDAFNAKTTISMKKKKTARKEDSGSVSEEDEDEVVIKEVYTGVSICLLSTKACG